jgi:hypothetical protein
VVHGKLHLLHFAAQAQGGWLLGLWVVAVMHGERYLLDSLILAVL